MTIRMLLAAVLLLPAAAGAQGWGGEGHDPNRPASAEAAPASAPVTRAAPKIKPKAQAVRSEDRGAMELDDAALERARVMVDREMAARKTALAEQTQRFDGYHRAMEKDSLDAERQMAEERKAFLLYLKSVPQEDRAAAMKTFEERQADKRSELDKRHLSQYKAWFEENIRDNWRTQPLAAEDVSMVSASAEAPAPQPAMAQAAPERRAAPAVHAKPHHRVVRRARRAQARARMETHVERPAAVAAPAPAPPPEPAAPAPVQAAAQPR